MATKATRGKTARPPQPKAQGKTKSSGAKSRRKRQQSDVRLRPGQLDGLVLDYLKKHKGELPLTPTKVAHGIKRSSGAVGNCLGRLEEKKKVKLTNQKPRRYDLPSSTK